MLSGVREIPALTSYQRKDYKVIDRENLSLLELDEIYCLQKIIGISFQ